MSEQTKYFQFNLPDDESTVWGDEMRDNWNNLDDQLKSVKDSLGNPQKDMQLHRESGDHDNRYYTKDELNAGALDSIYLTKSQLNGGHLDGLYYTKSETFYGEDQLLKWDADALYLEKVGAIAEFDKRFYTQSQLRDLSGPTPTSLLATKAEFDALVDTIDAYRADLQLDIDAIVANFNNTKDLIELVQVKNGDGSLKIYYTSEGKILGYSMQVRYSVVSNGQVISYPIFYIPYAFDTKGIISQKNTGVIDPDTPPLTGWRFDSEVRSWTLSEVLKGATVSLKPGFSPTLNQFQYFNFGMDDNYLTMGDPNATSATTTDTTSTTTPIGGNLDYYVFFPTYANEFKIVTNDTPRTEDNSADLATNKVYSSFRKAYTSHTGRYFFNRTSYYSFAPDISGTTLNRSVLYHLDYDDNILEEIPIGLPGSADDPYTTPQDNNTFNRRPFDLDVYNDPNSNSLKYTATDIHVHGSYFYIASQLRVRRYSISTGKQDPYFNVNYPEPTNSSYITSSRLCADPVVWGMGIFPKRKYSAADNVGDGDVWVYVLVAYLRKAALGITATLPRCELHVYDGRLDLSLATPLSPTFSRVLPYSYDGVNANWLFNDFWVTGGIQSGNNVLFARSSDPAWNEFYIDVYESENVNSLGGRGWAVMPSGNAPIATYSFGANVNEGAGEWDGHFGITANGVYTTGYG